MAERHQPPRLIAACLHLAGDRGMKGRCPVHQEYMAGRRPVACLSLRWLHAWCAVASTVVLRPAGRAARAGYGGVLEAAREQDRGGAGPGLVRVRSAAAKYRVWRRTLAGCSASRERRRQGVACLLVPAAGSAAQVAGRIATGRQRALCRVGLSVCCPMVFAVCGRSRARYLL